MEALKKQRLDWIDIAKGIAIIGTLVGHNYGGPVRSLIAAFNIPLFFVLAGYTSKQIPSGQFAGAAFKDFKRLIVPVLIVKFLQALLETAVHQTPIIKSLAGALLELAWGNGCSYWKFPGVGIVWFLITLFYSRLLFRLALNLIPKYRQIFLAFLAFVFCAVGGKVWLPQNFDLLFPAILFMEAGYEFRHKIDEDSKPVKIAGLLALVFWIYMSWDKEIYIELAIRHYPLSIVCIAVALCGSLCAIQFSKAIEGLKSSKALVFVGIYSLDLLCIHQFEEYFSLLWKNASFFENIRIFGKNPAIYLELLFHVALDLAILVLWVFVKEKIVKKLFAKFKAGAQQTL